MHLKLHLIPVKLKMEGDFYFLYFQHVHFLLNRPPVITHHCCPHQSFMLSRPSVDMLVSTAGSGSELAPVPLFILFICWFFYLGPLHLQFMSHLLPPLSSLPASLCLFYFFSLFYYLNLAGVAGWCGDF